MFYRQLVLYASLALFPCVSFSFHVWAAALPDETVTITVKATPSSEFRSELTVRSASWNEALHRLKPGQPASGPSSPSDAELTVTGTNGSVAYFVLADGSLLRTADGAAFTLPRKFAEELVGTVSRLRARHYGQTLPWNEAKELIPKKAKFTVMDLETGLRFRVQRRAGAMHADVQPLTKEDTAIMHDIYGGVWSWNRRAVLIETNKGWIAGSMHGMPHGGDGIPDNGFRGHFCIHFQDSVTHGSGSLDLAHQAMVFKAGGKLKEYVDRLPAERLVDLFLVSVNQKDPFLMRLLTADGAAFHEISNFWLDPALKKVRLLSEWKNESYEQETAVSLPVRLSLWSDRSKAETKHFVLQLARSGEQGPWKIRQITAIKATARLLHRRGSVTMAL